MSQNTQPYPTTGTDFQALPVVRDDDPLALADTLKLVACPICRAAYVSLGEQRISMLETAFLAVCHFCFRCQRPACPQCWNPVHHVCAACCEEAHLPFRGPVPSLEGLIFASARSAWANNVSFLCKRNGRFYMPEPVQPSQESAPSLSSPGEPVTSSSLPALQAKRAASSENYPAWLREAFGQIADSPVAPAPAVEARPWENPAHTSPVEPAAAWSLAQPPMPLADAPTQPAAQPPTPLADAPAQPPAQPQTTPADAPAQPPAQPQPAPPEPSSNVADSQEDEDEEDEASEEITLSERIENILIVITSILLVSVILMIVLAISLVQVNTFLLNVLHIDIRTEIAYLLQLR